MNGILEIILSAVASLGGIGLIKFIFFMPSEKRKVRAEAEIKEFEAEEKEMNVMKVLVQSLKERVEQQDEKIKMLNDKVDILYAEKHKLEKINNDLTKENSLLKIQLTEAEKRMCLRTDEECKSRKRPDSLCTYHIARDYYERYYPEQTRQDDIAAEDGTQQQDEWLNI